MWGLRNHTPYAAERTWIRDKHGMHQWVIAVKASFDIVNDGRLKLADEQKLPLRAPEYYGEPGKSSVRYDADLGPMKPTTDITLLAHAYAPGNRPTTAVLVSLRIDALRKELIVHGERVYRRGLLNVAPSTAVPFTRRPITYELAYGGTDNTARDPKRHAHDPRNPVGLGFAVQPKSLVGKQAPSIEYSESSRSRPAGFGPIDTHWSPRREFAGTYDVQWARTRKPLLPLDYDDRFTLCAPTDQQSPQYLHGGESVELVRLTPNGLLRLTLPRIYLIFTTLFAQRREEHRGRLVSVVIEPDDLRLTLCWRTTLPVKTREMDYLDETIIDEKRYII